MKILRFLIPLLFGGAIALHFYAPFQPSLDKARTDLVSTKQKLDKDLMDRFKR